MIILLPVPAFITKNIEGCRKSSAPTFYVH